MRRSEGEQTPGTLKNIRHLGIGLLTGVVVCVLLLLLASFGVSLGFLPEGAVKNVTLACCLHGSVIGSLMFSRRIGSRFLLNGALFAEPILPRCIFLARSCFCAFIPSGRSGKYSAQRPDRRCVLGGVFGANVKKRRR
jgi:putative membrane protein (TIGR04086 family)